MAFDKIKAMMKAKSAWDRFSRNHPKFPAFANAAKAMGIHEGTILGLSIEGPDGRKIETNVKVTADDLALFEELKDLRP